MIKCLPNSSSRFSTARPRSLARAKILEIGPYPPPFNGWSTRIFIVKNELERSGHTCVPLNLGDHRKIHSADYECVCSGWEYLYKLVKYARRGYLFHIHTNGESWKGFMVNLIAYFTAFAFLRRPVLTFHAGADQTFFPRHKSWRAIPVLKFMFGCAKGVICDDPEVAIRIADYGISPRKVIAINPFSRQNLVFASSETADEKIESFFETHATVVFTYVEFRPEYALESIFQAVGKLSSRNPHLGLIVVGATNEKNAIAELAKAAGVARHCLHTGAVDHAVFLSMLRRVSVYLRSAKTEGISASIREALHFGIPVVANSVETHPHGVFTYSWGNVDEIVKTIELVLSASGTVKNPKKPRELAEAPETEVEEAALLVRCALGESSRYRDALALQPND
jgi:glycosyltransferase involved in cell wall biosynthesis